MKKLICFLIPIFLALSGCTLNAPKKLDRPGLETAKLTPIQKAVFRETSDLDLAKIYGYARVRVLGSAKTQIVRMPPAKVARFGVNRAMTWHAPKKLGSAGPVSFSKIETHFAGWGEVFLGGFVLSTPIGPIMILGGVGLYYANEYCAENPMNWFPIYTMSGSASNVVSVTTLRMSAKAFSFTVPNIGGR
jgi:hypothetical protein